MKTNAQWYLMLPEPYRMQAMNNAEKEDQLCREAKSLASALCAFPWDNTPQGHKHWKTIYTQAKEGEYSGEGELGEK